MGNDGGSIPGRQDLVKSKKKHKKRETEEIVKKSRSKYCNLTKELLRKPIVGDRLGQIYNKTSILKGLIENNIPSAFRHITSLKDVKELNVELSENGNIKCPISLVEYSGINEFYFVWKCGCVFSKKAFDELKSKNVCINCGAKYNDSDLISLNYSKEEKDRILNEILKKKELKKLENKKKEEEIKDKITSSNNVFLNKKRERSNDKEEDIKV